MKISFNTYNLELTFTLEEREVIRIFLTYNHIFVMIPLHFL